MKLFLYVCMHAHVSDRVSVGVYTHTQHVKLKFSLFSSLCAGESKLVLVFFIILKGKYVNLILH